MRINILFTLFIINFISSEAFSQCDSVVIEQETEVDDIFYTSYRQKVTHYSSTGKVLDITYAGQSEPGAFWVVSAIDSFQYDSNDSLIYHISMSSIQFPNPTIYKYEYSYDVSGNKLTETRSNFNAGWYIFQSDTNVYDLQNNLLSTVHFSIYPSQIYKALHSYDLNNNDISVIIQSWSGTSWNDSLREDKVYNVSGQKIENYSMKFITGIWDSTMVEYFHFNSNSLLDTSYTMKKTLGVWENYQMEVYTYGILNKQIHHYTLTWDISQWLYEHDEFTDVDAYGYLSYRESYYAYYTPTLVWSSEMGSYSQVNDSLGNILSWESDPSPGGPGNGSYHYSNGVLSAVYIHTETMGGFISDKTFNYYYAELFGDTISCAGLSNVLSVDSCPGNTYLWNTGDTTASLSIDSSGYFQVTITRPNGWVVTTPQIHVEISGSLPIVYQSADSVVNLCMGENVVLYSIHENGVSYQWYRGSLLLSSQNENLIQLYSGNQQGDYFLVATSGCGSDTSSISQLVVHQNPTPVITASGPLDICEGDSLILTCSSADSYLWLLSGETTQSITVSNSGTYEVEVLNADGCSNESNISVFEHTFVPTSTVLITNNGLISSPNVTPIQWYLDGVAIAGATQGYFIPTIAGNYSYIVSTFVSCPTFSDTVYIDPSILNVSAGADVWACYGSTDVLIGILNPFIGGVAPFTYSWSSGVVNLGNGRAKIANATSNRTFTLTVTDSQGQVATDQVNFFVYQVVPSTISEATLPFCQSNIETVQLNYSTAMVQKWIVNGDTVNSGARTYNLTASSICQVIYLDSNNCLITTEPDTFYFNQVIPGPHIFLEPTTGFCQTGVGTYWVNSNPGSTYRWEVDQNTFSTDTLVNIVYPDQYTLFETDVNGCEQSSDFQVIPTMSRSDMDLVLVHSGNCDSVFLEAPEIVGANYSWQYNSTWYSGNSYRVNITLAGNYYCKIILPDGCETDCIYTYNGINSIVFSIDSLNGMLFYDGPFVQGTGYQWLFNGVPITGAMNNYYFPLISGEYTLRILNFGTCYQYSNSINAISCTINLINSTSQVCIGSCIGSANVVATGTPPFEYLWSNGATTSSVSGLCSGNHSISVIDSTGCNSISNFVIETDSMNFTTDVRHTSCIACSNGSFLLNVDEPVGSYTISIDPPQGIITGDSITGLPPGFYQICVTDLLGCIRCDNLTILQDPTMVLDIKDQLIVVYPNPARSEIVISVENGIKDARYLIVNNLGQTLLDGRMQGINTRVSLEELTVGLYFLKIEGKINKVFPVIKN